MHARRTKEAEIKHEIEAARPAHLTPAWPGKYELFSWLDYAVNVPEDDEVVDAGFTTVEPAQKAKAPRIAKCPINLECTLAWDQPLGDENGWHVFAGKVEHVAMDDAAFELDPAKRLKNLRTMCNLRSTLNPLTGEAGTSSLPVIGEG